METNFDVIIIGGGASGMMAGIFASQNGKKVLILDHNEKLGKKLFITGKGKCNLTNNSDIQTHMSNIVSNPKFMFSALNSFTPQDTISFFENNGMPVRTERGKRVFPESNKSSDVIKTLEKLLHLNGVKISLNTEILSVKKIDDVFHILCGSNIEYTTNSLIVATGGLSYSGTGATGLGYKIAKQFGHTIVETKSALCPIKVKENVEELNGLALRNVILSCKIGKFQFSELGELLFTFNSLTGPLPLTLSSLINRKDIENQKLSIDLKPGLTKEKLDEKLKREIVEFAKKDLKNYLHSLLPSSFVEYFLRRSKIENKKMADLNKQERETIVNLLKKFDFSIDCLDNINVSIVTAGGVNVSEINSKNCMSKLCKNLYFVGEVLDVDALTGGFNLQIAWSTGYVAGTSVGG